MSNDNSVFIKAGQTARFPVASNDPLASIQHLQTVDELTNLQGLAVSRKLTTANPNLSAMQLKSAVSRTVIRRSCLAMVALVWLIAGPASYAQSLDPHKPAPLGPGVNKGNADGGTGSHYYYFLAGPGHVNVKMAFLEMGIFGNPRQEALSFDFYNESGKLMSHYAVVSFDRLERIETGGDFGSRQKIVLAIVPQRGLVRLGGYYEVEVTGAGTFDRGTAVGLDVKPIDTRLVHPGGTELVHPGGTELVHPVGRACSARRSAFSAWQGVSHR